HLSLVLGSPQPLYAQPQEVGAAASSVELPRLAGEVTIDDRLDEADWSRAALIEDLHQVFPVDRAAPTEATEVRVVYTENALYVGTRMRERDTSQITDLVLRHGQSLDSDDVFAVILDPYLERRNAYRFEVNPYAVRWEGFFQNINEI